MYYILSLITYYSRTRHLKLTGTSVLIIFEDHSQWTTYGEPSYLHTLQTAPRLPLTWFSPSRQLLPSFLLVERLYQSYVITVLLQSFSNNKSLFQSYYSEFQESTYNSSLHVELSHSVITFLQANYPPRTSCEVNSSLNSLLNIITFSYPEVQSLVHLSCFVWTTKIKLTHLFIFILFISFLSFKLSSEALVEHHFSI